MTYILSKIIVYVVLAPAGNTHFLQCLVLACEVFFMTWPYIAAQLINALVLKKYNLCLYISILFLDIVL